MTIITIRNAYFLSYFKIKGFKIIEFKATNKRYKLPKNATELWPWVCILNVVTLERQN